MTIKEQMAAILADADKNGGVMTAEQITQFEALEAQAAAQLATEQKRAAMDALQESTGRKTMHIEHVKDMREDHPNAGFGNLAEFAKAVAASCKQGGHVDERLRIMGAPSSVQKGFAEDGGFAVPAGMRDEIWANVYTGDDLISLVDQEPTESNAVEITTDESTPWGATGVTAYWGAEGAAMTASKLDLSGVTVRLHKVHALVNASEELLEDGARLQRRLTVAAPAAIQYEIGDAIINGNGVGKPLGMLTAASKIEVAKESGQAANTINATNVTKMFSRLPASSVNRAVWFVNQDTFSALSTMTVGDQPVYLPPNGLVGGPLGLLLGRPVYSIEHCATLGTVGDIILADPKGYYLPVKSGGMKFNTSMHLYFDYDVMSFKWTFRVGGRPYLSAAINPAKGSNTRSHVITLATRA